MKKITLLVAVIGFAAIGKSFAQRNSSLPVNTNKQNVSQPVKFDSEKFRANKNKYVGSSSRSTQSVWLNYGVAMDDINGGESVLNINYLFPDSTVLGEFGAGQFSSVWIHNIADVLDVTSPNFINISWGKKNIFSVDSMSIVYTYDRHIQNTSIVDTLIFDLFHNGTASNMQGNGFIGSTAANYGTDTVGFKDLTYAFTTNTVVATGKVTVKVPLTDADASPADAVEKFFAVSGFNVPAGKLVGCSVRFKPGYSYNFGDTITSQLNEFHFTSFEENGDNTYPSYLDCNYQASNCDYNTSYIVPSDIRYNLDPPPGWNGSFIPTYAYTQPYSLEHHLISYKVTSTNVGIEEESKSDLTLSQNIPNPFNNTTLINYEITKNVTNVTLDVFDITGKKVMTLNEGSTPAGKHSFNLNADFNSGVYFYTLKAGDYTLTKKMTVVK